MTGKWGYEDKAGGAVRGIRDRYAAAIPCAR